MPLRLCVFNDDRLHVRGCVCLRGLRVDYKSVCVKCMQVGIVLSLSRGRGRTRVSSSFFVCYLFEKSVRLIQYKDMKVINLCFLLLLLFPLRILVSLGICEWVGVWEWGNTIVKWLMMVCVTKLTGRDFVCFHLWMGWISTITAICVCLFPCECVSLYCLKAFLYTIRYYWMVCVCLSVSEPTKHVPVCFFFLFS